MSRPPITCHILDTTTGRPAANVQCELSYLSNEESSISATAYTNADGRVPRWETDGNSAWITTSLKKGVYKVRFHTQSYFDSNERETFFPHVDIVFKVENIDEHYHIPLLLSNYGYSTYRGS